MNNKSFLISAIILLSVSMMTGCNQRGNNNEYNEYSDKSELLNKTSIGEASINNISKYTAIGVGKLDKASPHQRYRLIDKKNDGEEEYSEYDDLSNTLVGLTNEGIIEELSLTIQSGQQLGSSTFTITYYEELGDFILVSVLPMDVQEYVAGVFNHETQTIGDPETWNDSIGNYDRIFEITYRDVVASAIERLKYPLKYSIRYQDPDTEEYKYIDTSYLIHKRSGKLFPFSSREYCVDPQKCRFGEFYSPSIYVNNENDTIYPVNYLAQFYWYGDLRYGLGWDDVNKKPLIDIWNDYISFFYSNDGYYDDFQYHFFDNGFYVFSPRVIRYDDEDINNQEVRTDNRYMNIVIFNEETSSLEITNMKVIVHDRGGWWEDQGTVITVGHKIVLDKYGNFLCKYNNYGMFYNIYSKTFGRVNVKAFEENDYAWSEGGYLNCWVKQYYYYEDVEYRRDDGWTEYKSYVVFLNEELKEDYRVPMNDLNPINDSCGVNLLDVIDNYDRQYQINKNERLFFTENTIVKASLDANGRYSSSMKATKLFISPKNFFVFNKDGCYYLDGLNVHKVSFTNNYNSCVDTLLASLDDYPFVDKVWYVGNGILAFEGMDNHLNTITGYIYPDGTISFEVEEFGVDSQTSTLSPIN